MNTSTSEAKAKLRRRLRRALLALSPGERAEKSRQICDHVVELPDFALGKTVLSFSSLPDEPDLAHLWQAASGLGVRLAFPRVDGKRLSHWRARGPEELSAGAFGILEPDVNVCEAILPGGLDVILVPGLAFNTETGVRLGRGGGFYDRFLAELPDDVVTVGIGFDFQFLEDVPSEPHDCAVQFLVSESGLKRVPGQ